MRDFTDAIFKITIIMLFGIFVFFYVSNSSVGRYQFDKRGLIVLDTQTGELYQVKQKLTNQNEK